MSKILVIDDEARVMELLTEALNEEGYEVATASTPDLAIEAVSKGSFDLIILDVILGKESGITLLKKIRESNSKTPIIVYSGFVTSDLEMEARRNGAIEVLRKDVGLMALTEQIARILKAKDRIMNDLPVSIGKTILIVDDEAENRKLLKIFFDEKGYNTIEAKNGEEAIALAQSKDPSVVLLDLNMPVMDGLTVLKKLLAMKPDLGVIMVTGNQEDKNVKIALDLGAYGYVLKPFDFSYLGVVVMSKLKIAESG